MFGLVAGVGVTVLWMSIKEKVSLKWYEWGLTGLIVFMAAFMMQTFWASFDEWAPQAAWLSLFFFGLPIVILSVMLTRSVKRRMPKSE